MEEPIIPKTTRRRVSSSNIAAIAYYGELSILEVEFLNGSIYHYFDVPESQFEAIIAAPSHGKYLHRHIMGRYRYQRVQEARAYRTERRHRRAHTDLFRIYACDWCLRISEQSDQ